MYGGSTLRGMLHNIETQQFNIIIQKLTNPHAKSVLKSDSTAKNTLIKNLKIGKINMDIFPNNTKSSIL